MRKRKKAERRNVWLYQPVMPVENTPIEIRVTEPGDEKNLIGRLYISKGGVIWCDRNQRYAKKKGYTWEALADMLRE